MRPFGGPGLKLCTKRSFSEAGEELNSRDRARTKCELVTLVEAYFNQNVVLAQNQATETLTPVRTGRGKGFSSHVFLFHSSCSAAICRRGFISVLRVCVLSKLQFPPLRLSLPPLDISLSDKKPISHPCHYLLFTHYMA